MICDPPPAEGAPDDRLIHLETIVTHLQYEVEQLNAGFLAQQAEMKSLREALARLERRLDAAAEPEERDLLAERPPHH